MPGEVQVRAGVPLVQVLVLRLLEGTPAQLTAESARQAVKAGVAGRLGPLMEGVDDVGDRVGVVAAIDLRLDGRGEIPCLHRRTGRLLRRLGELMGKRIEAGWVAGLLGSAVGLDVRGGRGRAVGLAKGGVLLGSVDRGAMATGKGVGGHSLAKV